MPELLITQLIASTSRLEDKHHSLKKARLT